MDQYMSIDINVPKLLEWLISRRHCQKDWQKDIAKIRLKINTALQDMPEHKDIAALLSGSYMNYFHCLKIVEILRETEADSKNIFGRYSSKRMKEWNEVISLYQKNNVYLAEAADMLISMTKFDIPNLKKQITKLHQMENEFKKKEREASKAGVTLQNELNQLMKELGLRAKGSGYSVGLLESAKGLSATHDNIAAHSSALLPAVQHYTAFSQFTQPQSTIDMSILHYITDKGNTTMYEYVKGEKPSKVILPSIHIKEESDVNYDSIDWGLAWEDNIQKISSDGIEVLPSDGFEVISSDGIEVISFDGNSQILSSDDNIQATEESNEKTAEGNLALSLLDNIQTRTKFINNLLELKAFLKLRLFESDFEGGLDTVGESVEAVQRMITSVENLIKLMTNPTIQHQYNLTHNPRYLEEIIRKLNQKESAIERSATVVEVSQGRAKDSAAQVVDVNSKLKRFTQKCSQLQNEVAADISKKYNGREVFLIGGV